MQDFKEEEKKEQKPKAIERMEEKLKKIKLENYYMADSEEVELKKLDEDDLEEVAKIVGKFGIEISSSVKALIKDILKKNASYGALVDRLLVAVSLAWPVGFDIESKAFNNEEENCLYIEDIFLLIAYEGKGIREKLLDISEEEARKRKLKYLAIITGNNPKEDDIFEYIKKRGTKLEMSLLNKGFKFARSEDGLVAFKELL